MSALAALLLAAAPAGAGWPLTQAELDGQSWVHDPRVDDAVPCAPKTTTPIELRLFARVKTGPQLRLTVKNCGSKPVKLLHDTLLQPSRLAFAAKLKPPFDERALERYDPTVLTRAFLTLAAGEERVLADQTFKREGEAYSVGWGPFRYSGVPLGKQKVTVVFDAWVDSGFDEQAGKKATVENAAVGAFKSNEVTLSLP